jgi:hypothetical protein
MLGAPPGFKNQVLQSRPGSIILAVKRFKSLQKAGPEWIFPQQKAALHASCKANM